MWHFQVKRGVQFLARAGDSLRHSPWWDPLGRDLLGKQGLGPPWAPHLLEWSWGAAASLGLP